VQDAPVLLTIPGGTLPAAALGDTACIVDEDHVTLLPWELEKDVTGRAEVWIRVPEVPGASASRTLWIYAGGPGGEGCTNPSGDVWDGLYVAVYHLDSSLLDSTSGGNDLTNAGSADIAGQVGRGRHTDWDGDEHVRVDSPSAALLLRNDLTVEAWMDADILYSGSYDNTAVAFGANGEQLADNYLFSLHARSSGALRVFWEYSGATNYTGTSDGSSLSSGAGWQMLAFTRDVSASTVRYYVDGAADGSDSFPATSSNGGGGRLYIGRDPDSSSNNARAAIDEVRLSGDVKSPAWIRLQYEAVRGNAASLGAAESL
jgi:hypothetical protein